MAMELESDAFFQKRVLGLVEKLLWGQQMRPVTAAEATLINRQEELQALDAALPDGLMALLRKADPFVHPKDAVFLLLKAQQAGQALLTYAQELLTVAVREERFLEEAELNEALAKADAMPASWAVGFHGEDREEQLPPSPLGSSLDLERLRNFR